MSQIYPKDRRTNYTIREGRSIAEKLLNQFSDSQVIGGTDGPH